MLGETTLQDNKEQHLSKRLLWIMAVGCGASVANLYYVQPLLADMVKTFHASAHLIGYIPMPRKWALP